MKRDGFRSVSRIGWVAMITAGLGWLFDSYVINAYTFNLSAIEKTFSLSLYTVGIITSIYLVGYTLGTLFGGTIADYFGRKTSLIFSIIWYAVSAILTGFSGTKWMLSAFRLLTGIGAGGELPVSSTFITETWPAKLRNRGTGLMNMGYPLGYITMIGISYLVAGRWGWRAVFFFAIIPALLVTLVRLSLTESPAFTRVQGALKAKSTERRFTWLELISMRGLQRQLTGQILLWIGNGFTFWSFVTFVPLYLGQVGHLSKGQVFLYMLAYNGFYLVIPFLVAWLSDAIGRRWAGALSAVLAVIGVWLMTLNSSSHLYLLVVGGITYGLYAAPWVVGFTFSTEAFPASVRGSAIGVSMTAGRIVSILAPMLVGGIATSIGLGPTMRYAGLMWIVAIVGCLISKETRLVPLKDHLTVETQLEQVGTAPQI